MKDPTKRSFGRSLKFIFWILLLLAIGYAGLKLNQVFNFRNQVHSEESATVVIEQINKVSKLITVEGFFSEIYDYKDHTYFDVTPFRKKALIRIKAKVSMGLDFEGVDIRALPEDKTIEIGPLPPVEILSIDHELEYYDISEGTFNSFSEKDYNELQDKAKNYIRSIALNSDLVEKSEEQKKEILGLIRFYAEAMDWDVKIIGEDQSKEVVTDPLQQ